MHRLSIPCHRPTIGLFLSAWLSACAQQPAVWVPDDAEVLERQEVQVPIEPMTRDEAPALDVDPLTRQRFNAAVVDLQGGRTEAARLRLEKLATERPDLAGPVFNLGVIAHQAGDFTTAQQYFLQTLEIDAGHAAALNYLGVIHREQGDFDTSEQYYRRAIAADPEAPEAYLNLGILLDLYLGRMPEALQMWQQYQALLAEPDPRVSQWIADLEIRLQRGAP